MAKHKIRTKSRALYNTLRDRGMKKKKTAKIANGFDVKRVEDRPTASRGSASKATKPRKGSARKSPKGSGGGRRRTSKRS